MVIETVASDRPALAKELGINEGNPR